jgi:integrase/recombinase XerD
MSEVQTLSEEVLSAFRRKLQTGSRERSETTVERYQYELEKWSKWLQNERDKTVWDVDTTDLRRHLEELQLDDYADTTITVRRSAISQFYQQLSKLDDQELERDVPPNPEDGLSDDWHWSNGRTKTSAGIRNEDHIHYLNPEEVAELVDSVPAPKLRNSLIVKLMFNTGLRRGELAQIRLTDLDRDDRSIYVPPIKSPVARRVTYNIDYVGFELDQWLDKGYREAVYGADKSDYLFPTQESDHISGYRINSIVTEAAQEAGIQAEIASYAGNDERKIRKVTSHTLRHSYAVQAIKSDIDVRRLAEILGHKSKDGEINLDTTMVYLEMAERDYVQESRKFDPRV